MRRCAADCCDGDAVSARTGSCVHFTGVQNDVCKAGLRYDSVRVTGGGPIPCLTFNGKRNDCCAKYMEPTPEQIAAEEAEFEAVMEKHRIVMAGIRGWRTWSKKNRVAKQEVVECPACKGRLHLSQAAYNGHVWGKCETAGCVEWME